MRRKWNIWMTLGMLLILAAVGLSIYNLFDDCRAGKASAHVVEQLAVLKDYESREDTLSSQGVSPDTPMPTEIIDGNLYVGTLLIPSLGLELPVVSECSDEKLRLAPCRFAGSVYSDDMVIAAHSYAAHFGKLQDISYGSEVSFVDVRGNLFVYEVASIEELGPYDVGEMIGSAWGLTLFTCTFDGSARVTVRCKQVAVDI